MDEFQKVPEGVTFSSQPDTVNNEGISFTEELINRTQYSGKELDVRAQKYNYAVGIPLDEAKASLMSGEEMSLQDRASEIARLRNEAARSKLVQIGRTEDALLSKPEVDPAQAMESEFAGRVSATLPSLMSASAMSEVTKNPEILDRVLSATQEGLTKKELLSSVFQKWAPKIKDSTIAGSWGNLLSTDIPELFVPFLSWYRFRDVASKYAESGLLTSTNMEELIGSVYRATKEEAPQKAEEILTDLFNRNPYNAAAFLAGLDAYSTSDAFWDGVSDAFDVSSIPMLRMMKRASSFIRPSEIKLSGVAESAGNIEEAAKFKTIERITDLSKASGETESLSVLLRNAITLFNPEKVLTPTANLSSRRTEQLIKELQASQETLLKGVTDAIGIKRLDEGSGALGVALKEAEEKLRTRINHISGSILDTRYINADNTLANVAGVEARLGKKNLDEKTKITINLDPSLARSKEYNAFTKHLERLVKNDPDYTIFSSDFKNSTGLKKFYSQAVKDGFLIEGDETAKINSSKFGKLVDIKIETPLGKMDSTLFDSVEQAKNHANTWYGLKPGTFTIQEAGPSKYYISVVQQIDETLPQVRKALIEELRGTDPNDWTSVMLRKMGSSEALLSKSMSAARKVATHGTTDLLDAMAKHLNENLIKALDKEETGRFKSFITKQRDFESPSGEVLGKFSKNQAEFETEWMTLHNRLPNLNETSAYWNYVQISDFDWVLRNLSQYTKLSQEGYGMIGLSTDSYKMKKPLIEGKIVSEIPDFKGVPATVVEWMKSGEHRKLTKKEADDLLATGNYKIVKVHPEGTRKLESVDLWKLPPRTRYILTTDVAEAPLSWNRVAYNAGGHRVHVDDWFVSVEKVTRSGEGSIFDKSWYQGDFNVSSHMVRSQAQKMVDLMNEARLLLKEGKEAELGKFIQDRLPSDMTLDKFKKLFEANGLNINSAFKLRRKDQNLYDSHDLNSLYKNLAREADDPHLLDTSLEDTAFVGKREPNIPSYSFEGTAHNPTIRIGQSRLLDPISTLAKTVGANIRNQYMDDLKIKHARDFMARYGDLVSVESKESGLLDPIRHALDTPFKEGTSSLERLAAARQYRESIKNFFNIESTTQAEVRTFRDRLLETVFNTFGEEKAAALNEKMLHRINDPTMYLRSAAFHTKIGLFNIPSFMTQAMQFTTMMGIVGPVRAAEALAWGQYARILRKTDSPAIRERISSLAGQWGGNANDFHDYYEALKRSGLMTVKGESALLDDDKAFKVTQGAFGKFLDWGRAPFDMGEKLSRLTGFQIAFREWRASVGIGKRLDDDALRSIIGRTDDLTGNMTRASLATWQTGFWSLPTQFMNWHIRMGEQMLGNKLTAQEKARLVLSNAILYGIPAGLGSYGAASIVPWKAGVDYALNAAGVPSDSNIVTTTVVNGVMGSFFQLLSGDRFNPNEKWGPGKNPILDKIFGDENLFLSVISGVGGSTVSDMTKVAAPFLAQISARTFAGSTGELDFADIREELSKVVSSLGNAERLYAVINTGKYISKNEKTLAEVDNWKGWVNFMTGLQPREIGQAGEKQTYLNSIKTFQKTLEPSMLRYHREMYEYGQRGDLTQMEHIEKKLKALYIASGMTEKEIGKFEYRSFESMNKSWVEKTNEALGKRNERQYQRMIKEQMNNAKQ